MEILDQSIQEQQLTEQTENQNVEEVTIDTESLSNIPWYSDRYKTLVEEILINRPDLVSTLLSIEIKLPPSYYQDLVRQAPLAILILILNKIASQFGARYTSRILQYVSLLNQRAPDFTEMSTMLLEDILDHVV